MNLNQLYYFKTVAKLEHYGKASEVLNISQPSLSYAISSLEDELGTYLFEKQGRNIVITKYGKVFLKYVEDSLEQLELGKKKIKQLTNAAYGQIDISFIYTLAPDFIPKTVRNFLNVNENKDITFTFSQGITSEIITGLKEEKYDVGFCSYVKDESDIEFIPIIEQELVAIVPTDHELVNRTSIDLSEIANYPIITYSRNTGLGQVTLDLFERINVNPTIVCEAEEESAIAGLVSHNFGIAIVENIPLIKQFYVKSIPISNPKYKRHIYLAYVKNKFLPPAVRKFINFFQPISF